MSNDCLDLPQKLTPPECIDVPQLVFEKKDDRAPYQEREMVHRTLYVPPLDGTEDQRKDFDIWVASGVHHILTKHYPGYPWKAICDSRQGLVYFNIPILMGATLHWTIKLAQWEDFAIGGERLVIEGGGQLLERMNLPRTGFEAGSFLDARDNKHKLDFDFDNARRRAV
jgi:hypothetical protein